MSRPIVDGQISEPYTFEFFDDPISVANELRRARLGVLSPQKIAQIALQERGGATRRNLRVIARPVPQTVALPHPDYQPYNKALRAIVYARPTHMIYWKDERRRRADPQAQRQLVSARRRRAAPTLAREGLTWQLIAQRLNARYLPPGYVLDSGAPCAFLRPGLEPTELSFILGWAIAPLCERLLKEVVNHTKNIQSKDFERLPYPFWVSGERKQAIIAQVQQLVAAALAGRVVTREDEDVVRIGGMFEDRG